MTSVGARQSGFVRFVRTVAAELRWRLLGAVLVALALAAVEGTALLLLVPLLGLVGLDVDQGLTSRLASSMARAFAAFGLQPTLPTVLGIFLAVATSQALLYRAYLLLNPSLEQQFAVALRKRLYAAIVRVDWSLFIRQRISDLVHAVTSDIDRAGTAVYQFLTLLSGLAVTTVYVAIAFRLSPALTSIVAAAGAVLLLVSRGRTRRSSDIGERYSEVNRRQFHVISESINGLKVAKSFDAVERDIALFGRHADARTTAYLDLLRSFARTKLGLDLSSAVLICSLLFIAVQWLHVRGAGLLMLIFVFNRVMPRVMTLQESVQTVASGVPSFNAAIRLIDQCEEQADRSRTSDAAEAIPLRHEIRFDQVSYRYEGAKQDAVQELSVRIPAGRTVAIVGASGAGKSTFADLLIGLLRPSAGEVRVDGAAVKDDGIAAWRRTVGYVPQESFLLHDSVRANLRWAQPDATDAQMWSALERAAAAGFLRTRQGLDTIVGDRGVQLSGGERQRLALARALLRNPTLLVLDEATSALDSINEQQILETVRSLGGVVTTVIVTHRLTAIRDVDAIYVMSQGSIAESGTWNDLASRPSAFAQLLDAHGLDPQRTRSVASAASNPAVVS
jgi:ATP-binding cassette, subfamily C, bacterial